MSADSKVDHMAQDPYATEPNPDATGPTDDELELALDDDRPSRANARADLATCALCNRAVERSSTYRVNGQTGCPACVVKLREELAAQQPTMANLGFAGACGLVGALIGAAVWAAIAIATNFEIGYVAVLVGYLAGRGVKYGAGTQRGPVLQYIAVALAVVGLLAAKYLLFAHAVVDMAHKNGLEIGYFSELIRSHFGTVLVETSGPFDLLWVFLAVGAAYRVPKAHPVSISRI